MPKSARAAKISRSAKRSSSGKKKGRSAKTIRLPTRTRALSVHLGLNAVSAVHYGGWSGELMACDFDANDLAAIARDSGMK